MPIEGYRPGDPCHRLRSSSVAALYSPRALPIPSSYSSSTCLLNQRVLSVTTMIPTLPERKTHCKWAFVAVPETKCDKRIFTLRPIRSGPWQTGPGHARVPPKHTTYCHVASTLPNRSRAWNIATCESLHLQDFANNLSFRSTGFPVISFDFLATSWRPLEP